jgi:hypothetical protein
LYIYSGSDWFSEKASMLDQCCSTSAFWAFLGDGPVAFFSKLQRVTALSTTESEYKAMSKAALHELCKCNPTCAPTWSKTPHGLKGYHCSKIFAALESTKPAANALHTARALRSRQVSVCSAAMSAIGIRSILKDLGFEQAHLTYLLTDSKGAYASARNPINSKLRHVHMRYHRVRQAIRDNQIRPHFVTSAAQIADMGTKPLPAPQFERLRPLAQGYSVKPELPDNLHAMLSGNVPCTKSIRASPGPPPRAGAHAFTTNASNTPQYRFSAEALRQTYV